jgi:NADH-quinone oxidoreductase subunit M
MARRFPILAFCLGIIAFSSIGLPGLNGFTGEVTSLLGMFRVDRLYACLGLTGIILGAWYMLWLVQRTFFGRLREPLVEGHGPHTPPTDLNAREILALAPIIVLIFWIGIHPQFFTSRMEPSINKVVAGLTLARQHLADNGNDRAARQTAHIFPSIPVTGGAEPVARKH